MTLQTVLIVVLCIALVSVLACSYFVQRVTNVADKIISQYTQPITADDDVESCMPFVLVSEDRAEVLRDQSSGQSSS